MTTSQIEEARRAMEQHERASEALRVEARRRAEHRLRQMIDKIESAGGSADGTVGDPDPMVAVQEILRDQSFDEVIVSILPTRISRWFKMDLPNRVSGMTAAPVTTIAAQPRTDAAS